LGTGVMLKGKDNLKYIRVSQKKESFNRKFTFDCKCLVGQKYGSAFRIGHRGDLEQIDPLLVEQDELLEKEENDTEKKDNRHIDDLTNAENQKLKKEDIESMEEDGVTGNDIIQKLVVNSSTFNERTEYSKAKYVQKKKKKYVPEFLVLKPTTRLLVQMYFFKNPGKILEMRPDTLAQLLIRSNVQASSKVLMFESCQGLVCGSVLERLGECGKLLQLYTSTFPVRIIMEQFSLKTTHVTNSLCSLTIDKIAMLEKMFEDGKTDDEIMELCYGKNVLDLSIGKQQGCEKKEEEADDTEVVVDRKRKYDDHRKGKREHNNQEQRVAFISKEQRISESRAALSILRNKKEITNLIIASKYHPKNILLTLLPFLPASCPFVVYFPYKEPLMECRLILSDMKVAACLELTESWFRTIQVLPNRTHPQNMMSGSGGYLLHGIKIQP